MKRNYDECNEVFWGLDSFHYALEEEEIWDIEKYWKLEYFLIKLCKHLSGEMIIPKDLGANLYFLGRSINDLLEYYREPQYYQKLENYIEDEADYCKDSFNNIMRMLWGRIPFHINPYMISKNPLLK